MVELAYPLDDGKDYPHSSHLTAIMLDLDNRGLDLVSLTVRDARLPLDRRSKPVTWWPLQTGPAATVRLHRVRPPRAAVR
ncbi:hypothetical protein [Rhodococcus sp. BS-15]|uniref:hypothetical protein n=1 Tax=Rhodococcus sp. BS-15 TaxID=1304954 RepID=UPI000AC0970F|nr:hypothetical protein [Rhodococcus sp. BS-15]